MDLTYTLFDALRSFDNVRRENRQQYLNWLKANERFKGSPGYSADRAAAEKKRKAADDAAREPAAKTINECLRKMQENSKSAGCRALKAPTAEQVNILTVLNMKSSMTEQMLNRAALAMNGNGLCLSALNDIAAKHEQKTGLSPRTAKPGEQPKDIITFPDYMQYSNDLTDTAIENSLKAIVDAAKAILRSPVDQSVLSRAEAQKARYGTAFHIDDLEQRGELVSERAFYSGLIQPAEQYDAFMQAVNGK